MAAEEGVRGEGLALQIWRWMIWLEVPDLPMPEAEDWNRFSKLRFWLNGGVSGFMKDDKGGWLGRHFWEVLTEHCSGTAVEPCNSEQLSAVHCRDSAVHRPCSVGTVQCSYSAVQGQCSALVVHCTVKLKMDTDTDTKLVASVVWWRANLETSLDLRLTLT
jgi:hypothetical protein